MKSTVPENPLGRPAGPRRFRGFLLQRKWEYHGDMNGKS